MNADHVLTHPEAALLRAFVNTLDFRSFSQNGVRHRGGERLATPDELVSWLGERELLAADPATVRATDRDLVRAHTLREQVRNAIGGTATGSGSESGTGTGPGVSSAGGADTRGPAMSYRLITVPGEPPALAPAETGVDGALERIVLAVTAAAASGSWQRLKICEADDCRWVFYDQTRPGRGRWCAAELCGNRMKTRAYRQRHADRA
jgi:predicted RNA-binding Zn ribbon-like protein